MHGPDSTPSSADQPGSSAAPGASQGQAEEWFARDRDGNGPGLSFECTMCGNCCTGPEGYVLVSDAEVTTLAGRVGVTRERFLEQFTHMLPMGRSLIEKPSTFGNDCIFLDRETIPGKAVCAVYHDRPAQCRTWPFWPSLLRSEAAWNAAKRTCPGIDKGPRRTVQQIRIQRDAFSI